MPLPFPAGFEKRTDRAPGYIDAVQAIDGAAQSSPFQADRVPRGCALVVQGWTYDPVTQEPADRIIVAIDDNGAVEATYGISRPDVAVAFEKASLEATGFRAMVPTASLPLGRHEFKVNVIGKTAAYNESSAAFTFEVVHSAAQIPDLPRLPDAQITGKFDELPLNVVHGAVLVVRGFAIDLKRRRPCASVFVRVGGEVARAVYGFARDDVSVGLNAPHARFCGFTARLNTRALQAGQQEIGLIAVLSDGKGIAELASSATVNVTTADL